MVDQLPVPLLQAYSRANMSQPELNQLNIQEAIQRWARDTGDTGSMAVQVAVATAKIERLARHQTLHRKDMNCKMRIQILVHHRMRMLKYLNRTEPEKYLEVCAAFNIRANPFFDPTLPKRFPKPTGRKWKGKRVHLYAKQGRPGDRKPKNQKSVIM